MASKTPEDAGEEDDAEAEADVVPTLGVPASKLVSGRKATWKESLRSNVSST